MQDFSDLELKTKKIYVEQHKNYLIDQSIFDRHLKSAVDLSTYDLPASAFAGASILDAGCGNTGYFQVAMSRLGVKHVVCMDIGEDWMPELEKVLKTHNIPQQFFSMVSGSTTEIPLEDESFDLVFSNGVLMHLDGERSAGRAIHELTRVCRGGGTYTRT